VQEGLVPAGGLGVPPPVSNSLESPFGKGGLRGLKANYAKRQIPGYSIAGGSSDAESGESQRLDCLLFRVQKV
jgi:hypothetical protein